MASQLKILRGCLDKLPYIGKSRTSIPDLLREAFAEEARQFFLFKDEQGLGFTGLGFREPKRG